MGTQRLHAPARQSGAVLITGMIFLVVLTIFVLAMVRGGSLEERLARNARDQQVALESAEAVLRNAEETMFTGAPIDPYVPTAFTPACTNGMCFKPVDAALWEKIDWTSTALTRTFADSASNLDNIDTQPRYILEIVTPPAQVTSSAPCSPGIARITARGQGNNGAVAYVQSTFRFRVFTNIC